MDDKHLIKRGVRNVESLYDCVAVYHDELLFDCSNYKFRGENKFRPMNMKKLLKTRSL